MLLTPVVGATGLDGVCDQACGPSQVPGRQHHLPSEPLRLGSLTGMGCVACILPSSARLSLKP